jgi:hypothetical protein
MKKGPEGHAFRALTQWLTEPVCVRNSRLQDACLHGVKDAEGIVNTTTTTTRVAAGAHHETGIPPESDRPVKET